VNAPAATMYQKKPVDLELSDIPVLLLGVAV
jgi:hypothetical protein